MNILHVITTVSRGGAENHLIDLIGHQIRSGYVVGVAWLKGTNYWVKQLAAMGVEPFDLDLHYYGDVGVLMRLRRVLQIHRPQLLHAHLPPAELYARLALLGWPGVKFAISKHNDAPFYPGWGGGIAGRWVARRAERIICISQAVAKSVALGALNVPLSKSRCILYGIDPSRYYSDRRAQAETLRDNWRCSPNTVVFACVARMVPQKDHATLLAAYQKLRAQSSTDVRLVLIGDGPLLGDLQKQSTLLGIDDSVIFGGFRDDIPDVMSAMDVLCSPSLYEGFGLVLIEAMASARPVIATQVSSIPEIVVDEVTGLLVPKQDSDALACAMRAMLEPPKREVMGKAGRERAIKQFGLEKMFRQTDAVYAEMGVFPKGDNHAG